MTRDDQSTIALCKEIDATIATYQRRLQKYTREENPKKWTQINNQFGNEFYQAGAMIGDPTCLDQAIRAYRKVLEVYTQEDHPHSIPTPHPRSARMIARERNNRSGLVSQP